MWVTSSPISQTKLFALAVAAAFLPGGHADVETCLQALGRLNYAPYNASLPFLNGVSGKCHLVSRAFALYHYRPFSVYDETDLQALSIVHPCIILMMYHIGSVNVGYLYQKPMFAIMPNEAMGSFDLCRHSDFYTTGSVKTQYCTLSHDRAGVCVPVECTPQDMHDKALMQPLMNLGIQADLEVNKSFKDIPQSKA